jgi:type I site-specific restriction endonuclease
MDWIGLEPRLWQVEAVAAAKAQIDEAPVIRAIMGAGKSITIAQLIRELAPEKTVVTTPTVALVEQLTKTFRKAGLDAGMFYTRAKDTSAAVIVCCHPSLPQLTELIGDVDLWIADECHKTENPTVKSVLETWTPKRRIGFTATPYRASSAERLTLFESLAYDYGPAQGFADGVVVPPKIIHPEDEYEDVNEACIEMIHDTMEIGPGLVDAVSIKDAEEFAARLRQEGILARAIHSMQNDDIQASLIEELRSRKLDCLVHVQILAEGVDLPWLRWLCCRRRISSRVLFAQYVGRGLRSHLGKTHCVVLDPWNLFRDLSLSNEALLSGGAESVEELELDFLTAEELEKMAKDPKEGKTLAGVPLRLIDWSESYITKLRLEFEMRERINPSWDYVSSYAKPSKGQLKGLARLAPVVDDTEIPEEHRVSLRTIGRMCFLEEVSRKTARDLLVILADIRQKGWIYPNERNGK